MKSEYDPYYAKISTKQDSPGMKVPKTELSSSTSSCCARPDLLVPKTETASSCRTSSPIGSMRPAYDPYLNQDSNSSSMSSMETMGPRGSLHHMQHHSAAVMAQQQHHNPHQPPPPPPSAGAYGMDERQHQMGAHRSPYHQDEMYHRSYADMTEASSNASGIARPVVTYSTVGDMSGGRAAYDSALVNTAGHRPYDPGTATAFERYDPSAAQACVQPPQPPLMAQRVPPQSIYSVYDEHHQEQRYQQEAAAVAAAAAQQQQHQMAVANAAAAAAAAGMMKAEHSGDESTGPLYPRYNTTRNTHY